MVVTNKPQNNKTKQNRKNLIKDCSIRLKAAYIYFTLFVSSGKCSVDFSGSFWPLDLKKNLDKVSKKLAKVGVLENTFFVDCSNICI